MPAGSEFHTEGTVTLKQREAKVTVNKDVHCESKNWATFIFTVTLANGGRFQ